MFFEASILHGFWESFGRVSGGLGMDFRASGVILGYDGLFWAVGAFLLLTLPFACLLLLAAAQLESKFKISSTYGTHSELQL